MTLKTKDAGLRLRVEKELREEFVQACRSMGKPAAQVLREFMREFVAREQAGMQRGLFDAPGPLDQTMFTSSNEN